MNNVKHDDKQVDANVIFIQNEKLAFMGYTDEEEASPHRPVSTKNSNKNALELGTPNSRRNQPIW